MGIFNFVRKQRRGPKQQRRGSRRRQQLEQPAEGSTCAQGHQDELIEQLRELYPDAEIVVLQPRRPRPR